MQNYKGKDGGRWKGKDDGKKGKKGREESQ